MFEVICLGIPVLLFVGLIFYRSNGSGSLQNQNIVYVPESKEDEIKRYNTNPNGTLYRLKNIITYVKKKEFDGEKLFLDWYPRTNYWFYGTTQTISHTAGSMHDSNTLFRNHINASLANNNCIIELTEEQKKFIGLVDEKPSKKADEPSSTPANDASNPSASSN